MKPSKVQGLEGAQLREYQLVGLQWLMDLFDKRVNGILADEAGGPTLPLILAHMICSLHLCVLQKGHTLSVL